MASSHQHGIIGSSDELRSDCLSETSGSSELLSVDIASENNFEMKKCDRYAKDFEELTVLGVGGFGLVARARHYLDKKEYAVKKILLNINFTSDNEMVLREVRVMSGLNHPSIVRYYNSWIQPLNNENCNEDKISSLQDRNSTAMNKSGDHTSSSDSCVTFEKDITNDDLRMSPFMGIATGYIPRRRLGLFIQMQLGGQNLRSWLFDRNERELKVKQLWTKQDIIQHLNIVRDVISGLDYLHYNNIIHRDVKPANIVFHEDSSSVFLTDFGLSKYAKDNENNCNYSSSSSSSSSYESIGTPIYKAPELTTGTYDTKVDIFSLGIVLMELIYPFSSMSERAMVLQNLKNQNVIDIKFKKDWSYVVETILCMTKPDPNKRPNASILHKLVLNHIMQFVQEMDGTSTTGISVRDIKCGKSEKRTKRSSHSFNKNTRKTAGPSIRNKKVKGYSCNQMNTEADIVGKVLRKLNSLASGLKEIKSGIEVIKNIQEDIAEIKLMLSNVTLT